MIMLRNIYNGENICAFDNEIDAFEMLMALTEEINYETFCFHYLYCGNTFENSCHHANDEANDFIEGLYFQDFPYIQGDFPHLKEDD